MTAAALEPLGLSPKGLGALVVLASEGALSQRRLAERQGIDRTTMVAVVDELERLGAVRRARDEADRRAYALELTADGRRLLRRAQEVAAGVEDTFLEALPAADRRALRRALRTLVEAQRDGG